MRTVEEIREDIERVRDSIFMEQMADFMDKDAYRKLNYQLCKLKEELLQAERGK